MARASNVVVGTLSALFLVIGLGLVGLGVYFNFSHSSTICHKFLENSLFILGASISVISLLGLVGAWCKNNFMLGLYLVLMAILGVGLLAFAVFVFLITNQQASNTINEITRKDHKLGDWLQNHFVTGNNWEVVRSCLSEGRVCKAFSDKTIGDDAKEFLNKNFSPIQAGCCKPPKECGFEFKNATFWTKSPSSGHGAKDNMDCDLWSNDQQKLCYNCNSCKSGFLSNIKHQWRNLAIFLSCMDVLVFALLLTGCRANRNNNFYNHRRSYV